MIDEIKAAIALGLIALVAFGTWYATSDHYEKIIAQNAVAAGKAVTDQLEINAQDRAAKDAVIKQAGEDHDTNQKIIDGMHDFIVGGVPVHIPTCSRPVPGDSSANTDRDAASGVLPTDPNVAFKEFQRGIESDAKDADDLNVDAIRQNKSVGAAK